ncbi:MAG: hypothetical protein JXO72_14240 [Vicinamibacteria bacterium]|nr:hypothetical protein [Vicinamibacteria bacterium]
MSRRLQWSSRRRSLLTDVFGLGLLLFLVLDYLRPSLLVIPTIPAGGDTPCHFPTAVFLREQLLPQGRIHGWYPGAYLGHPLLLYYFPLPFLIMAFVSLMTPMPAAFKIVTALGVLLLPPLTFLALRRMGLRFPAPLLGAVAATVFLFLEENPIWGGTMASMLAGEFAYSFGTALAVLFLGLVFRDQNGSGRRWSAAFMLALTALAHGYAVLWAGLSATFFLFARRDRGAVLRRLSIVWGLAFAGAAFWLLPLLAEWRWTTPYNDPWIDIGWRNLAPPLLWPMFMMSAIGLVVFMGGARRADPMRAPFFFLLHAAAVAVALAIAGSALGVVNVRFLPFAQLSVCLAGAVALARIVACLRAPHLTALGLTILAVVFADAGNRVLRRWIEWNYTGLETKELWPAFDRLARELRGSAADPRVAVEYSPEHEKAGSIRAYETLPFFSGRSTLEGVYNQASLSSPAVYYLASELSAVAPNPYQTLAYSSFDPETALERLRLFNVSQVVALSARLIDALDARADVERAAHVPPYVVFNVKNPGPGYVEPLAYAPVRCSPSRWREKAYADLRRKPPARVPLVLTDDERFTLVNPENDFALPEVRLPDDVQVDEEIHGERILIRTSRIGHPLLVKVSYHPRWRVRGADGPFLVAPSLMLVVPREALVEMSYAARTWSDGLGGALTLLALLAWAGDRARGKVTASRP